MATFEDINIINHLLEIGFCSKCAVRSTKAEIDILKIDEELSSFCTTQLALEKSAQRNAICILCMGLLDDSLFRNIETEEIEEIRQEMEKYDCKTFRIDLTYPHCMVLRDHLMIHYLVNKFPDYYADVDHPIQRLQCIFRTTQTAVPSSLLNKTFDSESLLKLQVTFVHDDNEKELIKVIKLDESCYAERAQNLHKFKNKVVTKKLLLETLEKFRYDDLKKVFTIPPLPPKSPLQLSSYSVCHDDLYLAARILKYNRDPLKDDTMEFSCIISIIKCIAQVFRVEHSTINFQISYVSSFTCARILGNGRPIYIKLRNPVTTKFDPKLLPMKEIELNATCTAIQFEFKSLTYCNSTVRKHLPEVASTAIRKSELLLIVDENINVSDLIGKINNVSVPLKISQKRPLSMFIHFETLKRNECFVMSMLAKPVVGVDSSRLLTLEVTFTPSLYVNEFVTGDCGRTLPSLRSILGTRVGLLAADDYDSETPKWPSLEICDG